MISGQVSYNKININRKFLLFVLFLSVQKREEEDIRWIPMNVQTNSLFLHSLESLYSLHRRRWREYSIISVEHFVFAIDYYIACGKIEDSIFFTGSLSLNLCGSFTELDIFISDFSPFLSFLSKSCMIWNVDPS